MTFTSDVKEELAHVEPVCKHCNKATLSALMRIEGTLFVSGPGQYRVEMVIDSASTARLAIKLLHEIYNLDTEIVVRRSVLHKTPNYLIEIPRQNGLSDALLDLGILLEGGGLNMGVSDKLVAKQCCAAAYLRGAFLGSGFISDPKNDFHFEMSVESEDLATGIASIMQRKGINAKVMTRRNSCVVYLKSGNAILEFLAFTQAHRSAITMEEERVVKSIRNDVNRSINAELANEEKATRAALDQLLLIKKVLEHFDFESLPPGLKDFIRLRVANPDVSLKELGARANPPLSKSAVNHRLRRLEELSHTIPSVHNGDDLNASL